MCDSCHKGLVYCYRATSGATDGNLVLFGVEVKADESERRLVLCFD